MWSKDSNIHIYYISKYGRGEHATKANLIRNVLTLLPSQVNAPDWMERMEDTSLGYLLFTNGIYSFKNHQFKEQFDPSILFFHRIEYDYSERSYDIKDRIFYQQHGEEMGNYLIELLARALAGDCLKNIGFCLGTTNGGKSRFASILQTSLGGYVGTFQGECFAISNSTADEASKNRWILDISKKRIVYSSEIKTDCVLNGNLMKKVSSGEDRLVGRGHYEKEQSFRCHFLSLVCANDLPQIKPFDEAMDGRTLVFPFDKQYSMNPTGDQLQADPNLSQEMNTVEFKLSFLHTLLSAYQEFQRRGVLPVPEKSRQSRKEWIDAEPNLMESFKQTFEFTNDVEHYVPSSDLSDWVKNKGVTMTKLGRDINKYAETKKFENVKSKPKKIEGKTTQCWFGIRSVPVE
jgi:phage/plasmid-associated DNA primase